MHKIRWGRLIVLEKENNTINANVYTGSVLIVSLRAFFYHLKAHQSSRWRFVRLIAWWKGQANGFPYFCSLCARVVINLKWMCVTRTILNSFCFFFSFFFLPLLF